jgi:hypothetical protein
MSLVNRFTPGHLLGFCAQIWTLFGLSCVYDFGLHCWGFSLWSGGFPAITKLRECFALTNGHYLAGPDNAAWDLSIHAAVVHNSRMRESEHTHYISVCNNRRARPSHGWRWTSVPRMVKHVCLRLLWRRTKHANYDALQPYPGFSAEKWLASVTATSQHYSLHSFMLCRYFITFASTLLDICLHYAVVMPALCEVVTAGIVRIPYSTMLTVS